MNSLTTKVIQLGVHLGAAFPAEVAIFLALTIAIVHVERCLPLSDLHCIITEATKLCVWCRVREAADGAVTGRSPGRLAFDFEMHFAAVALPRRAAEAVLELWLAEVRLKLFAIAAEGLWQSVVLWQLVEVLRGAGAVEDVATHLEILVDLTIRSMVWRSQVLKVDSFAVEMVQLGVDFAATLAAEVPVLLALPVAVVHAQVLLAFGNRNIVVAIPAELRVWRAVRHAADGAVACCGPCRLTCNLELHFATMALAFVAPDKALSSAR